MDFPPLDTLLNQLPRKRVKELQLLTAAGFNTVISFLFNVPRKYIDRRAITPLSAYQDSVVNTRATVIGQHYKRFGKRSVLSVEIQDTTMSAQLLCFGRDAVKYLLPVGAHIYLSATFEMRNRQLQTSQFDFEKIDTPQHTDGRADIFSRFQKIVSVYRAPLGVSQQCMYSIVQLITQRAIPSTPSISDQNARSYLRLPLSKALQYLHAPATIAQAKNAYESLARYELLSLQVQLQKNRARHTPHAQSAPRAAQFATDTAHMLATHHISLPFTLTADQLQALFEINVDLKRAGKMNRLLQGDVGVGKTLVALLAALAVIHANGQVAFMVPTELLARQQAASAASLFKESAIKVAALTGAISRKERVVIREQIQSGAAHIIIGTHALISDDIHYHNLKMMIIDEQHRFGVRQRLSLQQKGEAVHNLYMTATPIPRTLALGLYSNFNVSVIRNSPAGRKPIKTHIVAQSNERRVYEAVRRELDAGHQAYFVYPLIEESKTNLRSAETMAKELAHGFFKAYSITCIHSQLDEQEKQLRMEQFTAGEVALLVATSVVEVGVDVPNATCIVINNAERFGLATLHQLRGRVGRSTLQSYAFLIFQDHTPLSDASKSRLKIIYQEQDGFLISEADLFLRGPGDIKGVKQSGENSFKVARFPHHFEAFKHARNIAPTLLQQYPHIAAQTDHYLYDALQLFA